MDNWDSSKNNKNEQTRENERRVDHLMNLVERETRTERHLEQNSDISNPENIEHAKKIQQQRENEINNLKNIIVTGEHSNNDQVKNLEKRYDYTDGYLKHNSDHMDKETLRSTEEKQEHRKNQLNSLK